MTPHRKHPPTAPEAQELTCTTCGSVYVLTRRPRLQRGPRKGPVCIVCRTLFALPYHTGHWDVRVIQRGNPPAGFEARQSRLLAFAATAIALFFTYAFTLMLRSPEAGAQNGWVRGLVFAVVIGMWVLAGSIWQEERRTRCAGEKRMPTEADTETDLNG